MEHCFAGRPIQVKGFVADLLHCISLVLHQLFRFLQQQKCKYYLSGKPAEKTNNRLHQQKHF
jgi:hypothetical protein